MPRRHLDLEGHELPTLSGARQLLQRDKPLLSYEVAVHRHQAHTKALLGYIDSLGYSSFLIEEIAGMTADVRNVLAVPASRLRAFTSSPALTAAYLGNVRRAPRFAGSPRLRRRRPAACPPVVLRLHRPRLQSPLSASCPPRTLRPSSRWTRVPLCCTPSPAARPSSPAAPAAATAVARTGRSTSGSGR